MNHNRPIYIHSGEVFTPQIHIENGAILIEGDLIRDVGPMEQVPSPQNAHKVDASGLSIVPGFIDLQCNGAFGYDFRSEPSSIWKAAGELPRFGITSFLPTIPTTTLDCIAAAQSLLMAGTRLTTQGAIPLGLHIEGPFLNPEKKGAHNETLLRSPDLAAVSNWSPETGIRLVTLAPELPKAMEMVVHLRRNGVVVSAGHSMASYEQAQAAIDAGVTYGTHLFNAMHPLNHRQPGLIAALLEDDRCTVGLIVDGIHLHRVLINMIFAIKQKISLVTDAMAALGMPPGNYRFVDRTVFVSQNEARLADGTLAGSVLSIDQAMRNMIKFTGCSLEQALEMITSIPASVLGVQSQRGQISPGLVADLVLLSPELQVTATYQAGKIVYHKRNVSR
jgi:N-acetylglucosamine-6-phosphate deacetylase